MAVLDTMVFLVVAIAASLAMAISFRTPLRHLYLTVPLGVIVIVLDKYLANKFLICLFVACLAHICARLTKAPTQGFLVPGFIFMVPGSAIYRTISAFAARNMTGALDEGMLALTMAVNISFAILIANWLVPSRSNL